MHQFKRFYLLGALTASIIIPLLSITFYIESVIEVPVNSTNASPILTNFTTSTTIIEEPENYLPTLLWSVYGIGVLLFTIRFITNIIRLFRTIIKNETLEKYSFIYVLLSSYRTPHSFFKYIFLNKEKFNNNAIPKEVLLHEETHAKQLHSIDILLLEVLQIIFWFHPLVYILKHHVKLNHEFLADQAVLNNGVDTKNYQHILLQFSSSTQNHQLASAINYSSIKKRFTVMKTQTSKTKIWTSTLLLLPILAILFYSFSDRKYVELPFEKNDITKSSIENLNQFLVSVERNGKTIELKCEKGCKWGHLTLEPSTKPYIINDFGFSEGSTIDSDRFAFTISTENNEIVLEGLKGTAWIDLAFTLPRNKVQGINQLGMTNLKTFRTSKKTFNTIDIIVKNDILYIDGKKSSLETYVSDFNKITENWSQRDYESTEPNLQHENGSAEFLGALNELHKKTIYFKKTVLGVDASITKTSNSIPVLEIKNDPDKLLLNGQETSLETLKSDFIKSTNGKKSELKINAYQPIQMSFINEIMTILGDNTLEKILLGGDDANNYIIVDDYLINEQNVSEKEMQAYNIWAKKIQAESKELSADATWYPPINEQDLIKYSGIYKRMSAKQKKQSVEYPFPNMEIDGTEAYITTNNQETVTRKQIEQYNAWAKPINAALIAQKKNQDVSFPILKQKEINTYKRIYNLMSEAQKKSAEPFPNLPPPPPPPPAPEKAPNSTKPPKNLKEIKSVKTTKSPRSAYEYLKSIKKSEITYFYNKKEVSYKDILKIVKENPNINMRENVKNNKGTIHFWSE
ncbi:MAG: hypothetical protein Wins2KO_25490 [Winogradskyella sp.]